MKRSLSLIVLALAMFSPLTMVHAQSSLGGGGGFGGGLGGPVFEPGNFRAFQGQLGQSLRTPGRVWFSGNYADRGLGFEGSYVTLGAKTRLFEDALDGRWLFEGRAHVSEEGGFFTNLGIERIFSVDAAGADVSLGFWFDYDDDQGAFPFSDAYEAVGVTGKIKTRFWDLTANGYFPIGTSDTFIGDPTGNNPFFGNSISLVPGIDSALTGFDVTVRTRPEALAFINGAIDFGGYGYESEFFDFFGGGRLRMSSQLMRGVIVTGEINYDDRFNATGLLGVTFVYGANARGNEFSGVGKDLDPTLRNDHIVRFNQNVVLAIDPDTGLPFNVIHVNNTADAAGADGSFENPFPTFALAEANSAPDDIIFVDDGDGTVTGLDEGINLQDGQLLLADGVAHLIPIANGGEFGTAFNLFNDLDGARPTITANNFGNAVTLADRNTVRGFIIDGSQATAGLGNGIFGSAAVENNGGLIDNNIITDAVLSGVSITNLSGDWTFTANDIQDNGFNGISLIDNCDPNSVFTFDSNVAANNGLDGIQIVNYEAAEINFTNNTTNSNGRDGVRLENFKGDPTVGTDITIDGHTAQSNIGDGISVIGGTGNLAITNSFIGTDATGQILGNTGNGINIVDFTTPNDGDQILLTGNTIENNGVGGGSGVNFELNQGFADVLITNNSLQFNGNGVRTQTDDLDPIDGIPTVLQIQVVDNVTISNNISDGLRFIALGGSSQSVLVENNASAVPQTINFNGGNGISFIAGDPNGGILSSLTGLVRNVDIFQSAGDGVFASIADDAQLSLLVEDSIIDENLNGFNLALDTNESQAVNTIIIQDNQIDSNAANGIVLNTLDGTFTDLVVINNQITNLLITPLTTTNIFQGIARSNGLTSEGLGFGINVNATGDGTLANPQIDNRTRVNIVGNTIDRFSLDGINLTSAGDASILATINANTITNNGEGFLAPPNAQPDLPFFDGIALNSIGTSSINATVTNNFVIGQTEFGVEIQTAGTSTINALFDSNNFNGNDIINDPNNDPFPDNMFIDFVAVNAVGSNIALSFTNNLVTGDVFANGGAPGDFLVELDGITNGILFGGGFPNISLIGFGTTVQPLLDAEEAAFTADGFPANPPPVLFP